MVTHFDQTSYPIYCRRRTARNCYIDCRHQKVLILYRCYLYTEDLCKSRLWNNGTVTRSGCVSMLEEISCQANKNIYVQKIRKWCLSSKGYDESCPGAAECNMSNWMTSGRQRELRASDRYMLICENAVISMRLEAWAYLIWYTECGSCCTIANEAGHVYISRVTAAYIE